MSFDCKYNYPQIARDSGFKLHQCRDGFLDWRLIGSLEVDKIIKEQQFEKIDDILSYLSEAPLAPALEINILDSGVGKYFFISQLAIQYLIFCRKFLDESVKALRESLIKTEMENKNLKALHQEHCDEIIQLNKKINKLESINHIIYPCHVCTKNFVSNDALNIHIFKKHSNTPNDVQAFSNDKALINTIKLELEIKHLRERLNIAEKDIREASENKMMHAKQCTTISSSEHINISNIDVGTQCNLLETKEEDCSSKEKDTKLIISELQEKILDLESWNEVHRFEEKDFMTDIVKTLQQINEAIHLKHDKDISSLKEIFEESVLALKFPEEIISACTNKLQSLLLNTVSNAMQENFEQFNTILNKIVIIRPEKELYSQKAVPEGKIKTKNYIQEIRINDLNVSERTTNKIADLHTNRLHNFEEPPTNEQFYADSFNICAPVSPLLDIDIVHISAKSNSKNVVIDDMLKKELALYGISNDARTISSNEATKVLSHMIENRIMIQNKNSTFKTTRDKLENFVNTLNMKNIGDEYVQKRLLNSFKLKFMYKNNTSKRNGCIETDSLRERLENILCSPIKKPPMNDLGHLADTNKPVPLPRKKVMFNSAQFDL